MKFACPGCGYKTLNSRPPGAFDICPVCFWEDDSIQYYDPDFEGGANASSLRQSQEFFKTKEGNKDFAYEYEDPRNIEHIRRMPLNEFAKILNALNLPIKNLLELYSGFIEVKQSNFVFNYEEIYNIMGNEGEFITRYLMLRRRKDPNE